MNIPKYKSGKKVSAGVYQRVHTRRWIVKQWIQYKLLPYIKQQWISILAIIISIIALLIK